MGKDKRYTSTGTDINEVKRKNEASGMSYNEILAVLARKGSQFPRSSEEISKEIHLRELDK